MYRNFFSPNNFDRHSLHVRNSQSRFTLEITVAKMHGASARYMLFVVIYTDELSLNSKERTTIYLHFMKN